MTLLTCVNSSFARINVVTLPGRDTVQLTIYNSADLTMVKETRHLTFRKGLNKLEFSWANTLIDPTSVEFRALTQADKIDVLDASFPPRVPNALEWRIQSEVAGDVVCEIQYFTSGITWSADYVAQADKLEKTMRLAGNVRITNHSGEDYENAQFRLVVGVIRLVEDIAVLARNAEPGTKERRQMKDELRDSVARLELEVVAIKAPAEIVKQGVSEYFLYTVGGRDTVQTGWSKRLPSFTTADIPVTSYYKLEKEQRGDAVRRFYRFKNDRPSHLGQEPLPDGDVKAFRTVSTDNLFAFIGDTSVKYIPIDETVDLDLGADAEVSVESKLMDWRKLEIHFDNWGNVDGWSVKELWQFDVQNSKDIDIVLDLRRTFQGDWTVRSETQYEKVDAQKIKFVLPLKPRAQQKFSYEVTTRYGVNATK